MSKGMARMDFGLFIALLLLLGFGIVLVYSSSFALAQLRFGGSEFFVARQTVRALLALASFMLFINVDYHLWGKLSNLAYVGAVVLLIAVLVVPGGQAINGAKRWLAIGPLSFQVSDLARMALVLYIARAVEQSGTAIKNYQVFLRILGAIGIICVLVLIEPGFSTSVIIGLIGVSMLFIAGSKVLHLGGLVLVALPVAALVAMKMPHSRLRLIGFYHMATSKESFGYQAYQSLIGLGNGGLWGVGLGRGEQKFFYLPEPHTDFVISILGEEIGFVGLMLVAAVFTFVIYRGMRIAQQAPDKMGQLMAFGFTFAIALYALLHAGVCAGLLPTTGVPLPFISYGGMSLIFMMSSMGILLNISSQTRFGMVAKSVNPAQRLSRMQG